MILNDFKIGWQNKFEQRLNALERLFPDITLQSVERYKGMLRVKFTSLDNDIQDVLDSVTYKIERESAQTCEGCGKQGRRTEEHLPEKMCLCWKCHALEIEQIQNS